MFDEGESETIPGEGVVFWACRFVYDGSWESYPPPPPLLNESFVRGFDFDEILPPPEDTRSVEQVEADRRKAKAAMKADRTQETAQAAVDLYTWKEKVGFDGLQTPQTLRHTLPDRVALRNRLANVHCKG